MSRELTLKTFGASVVVGLAAILIWGYVSRAKRNASGVKKASDPSHAIALYDRIGPILGYIYSIQGDEEGRSSVGALLVRLYGPIYFDLSRCDTDAKSAAEKLIGKSSGAIGATLLEGLGMKRAVKTAVNKNRTIGEYEYRDDLVLPVELTEEVLASVPHTGIRDAFQTSENYFELCKKRRSDASNAVTHSDETYEELLRALWDSSFISVGAPSSQASFGREGDGWSELGFQGKDPVTDLRGGGITALEDYVAFAQNNRHLHESMIRFNREEHAKKGTAWFLEACVSIQLTVQLTTSVRDSSGPSTVSGSAATRTGGRLLKKRDAPEAPAGSPLRFTVPVMTFLYNGRPSEMRKRLQRLHALYFRAFFALWSRDRPFIMEYQSFMENTYYPEAPLLVESYLAEPSS